MVTRQMGSEKPAKSTVGDADEGLPKMQQEPGFYQTPQLHEIGTLERVQGYGVKRRDFVTYQVN